VAQTNIEEQYEETAPVIEDAPRFSAETIAAGMAIQDIFRAQKPDVRRQLIRPLADTLTTTEAVSAGLSSEDAKELADSLEDNARRLRNYAENEAKTGRVAVSQVISGEFDY
jgi:phosphoglycerate-specific signal transduction histidine kinase